MIAIRIQNERIPIPHSPPNHTRKASAFSFFLHIRIRTLKRSIPAPAPRVLVRISVVSQAPIPKAYWLASKIKLTMQAERSPFRSFHGLESEAISNPKGIKTRKFKITSHNIPAFIISENGIRFNLRSWKNTTFEGRSSLKTIHQINTRR